MRRSAVIFVLIFTLIITNICTGCGSSASDQGGGPAKTESGGSSDPAGKTDPSGKTSDAGKSDAAGKTGDASSIPDTNESAVTDWGTADAGTSSAADEKKSSSESGPAPAFSQVLIDNDDLYFAIKDVRSDAADTENGHFAALKFLHCIGAQKDLRAQELVFQVPPSLQTLISQRLIP